MKKIIERVQKLLALGGSSNPHESAAALAKAQALMAEHNLSMGQLRLAEVGHYEHRSVFSVTKLKPYESNLMNLIARAFGCKLMYRNGLSQFKITATFIFIGPKSQLPMVEWTCKVLVKRLQKARAEFVRTGAGTKQADSFCLGWTIELSRKVFELSGAKDWEAALDEYCNVNLNPKGKKEIAKTDHDAYAVLAGQLAAQDEYVHRPMEGTSQQLIGG